MILYFSDAFTKPCRFEPHVVVDIDDEFDRLVAMLHCHQSQFYEWLPYNAGYLEQVPQDDDRPSRLAGRAVWRKGSSRWPSVIAIWSSGPTERSTAGRVRFIEAFEVSEYGAPLDASSPGPAVPVPARRFPAISPFTRKEWVDLPAGGVGR